jgi:hypothetical protein
MTRLELLQRRYGVAASTTRIWMMIESTARVPTDKASRYLQQLCKHWQHNLTVDFTAEAGTVIFPKDARGADWPGDAKLTLTAHDDNLECRIEASVEGQLAALKDAVARHLDRFAFRDAPLAFDWRDA